MVDTIREPACEGIVMDIQKFKVVFIVLLAAFLAANCASVPKLNKTSMLIEMEEGRHDAQIAAFKQAEWRAYVINDHEKIKLKGKDIVELFTVSKRCYEYMVKADEMMFAGGEVNPRLMELTADQLRALRQQFEQNLEIVCGQSLVNDQYQETGISAFFKKFFYPYLYTRYKAGIAALAFLEGVRREAGQ